MERLNIGQVLNSSFSLHSVAEGSEVISEADEIQEVHNLQTTGGRALHSRDYEVALRCYEDALEIDEHNVDSLCGRAGVYLQLGRYILAQLDAEKVLASEPGNSKALCLQAEALGSLGYYRESLIAYLKALELEGDSEDYRGVLSHNIARMSAKYCPMQQKLKRKLHDLDPYQKLVEVGSSLFQGHRYDLCVRVLDVARSFDATQMGVTLKLLLTLANAHSALKHSDLAISLYQDCLSNAQTCGDVTYQTKSLVSIASLFLELGQTHQAILYYEKLLDLQTTLQGESSNGALPDFWKKDLQCALHLNLSIAYKTIGSMDLAVKHAGTYMGLIEGQDILRVNAEALSQQNIGILHETLGHYVEALEHFKKFLSLSRKKADKNGISQAYGCLGTVYSKLGNIPLAKTYHEQFVNSAKSTGDDKLIAVAHEQFGDTYMYLECHEEAVEEYLHMLRACSRNDTHGQTKALCKIGKAYRTQKRYQYSIYYFEQAKVIAEDFDLAAVRNVCEYNLACIMQHSSQMKELSLATTYLKRLIPTLEGRIAQHHQEGTRCPDELKAELLECNQSLQIVLTKLGDTEQCLLYAEASRQETKYIGERGCDSFEHVKKFIDGQNATVLYYTILVESYLLWVLQPGRGIVRFHQWRSPNKGRSLIEDIRTEVDRIRISEDHTSDTEYENRSLPYSDEQLTLMRRKNQKLSGATDKTSVPANQKPDSQTDNQKSPGQVLFKLLITPIYDVLQSLEPGAPVIFVPDECLYGCPFGGFVDWSGVYLGDKFSITTINSLNSLQDATVSELKLLKIADSQEDERTQSRLGGVSRILGQTDSPRDLNGKSRTNAESDNLENVNLKCVSNPRLVTSRASVGQSLKTEIKTAQNSSLKRSNTFTKVKPVPFPTRTRKSDTPLGTPVSMEKMVGIHSLSTLTTRTSTNTDLTTSTTTVTEFRQVCDVDRCLVIGNPKLPEKLQLHGNPWSPRLDLKFAQTECSRIAEHFQVEAIVGAEATKERFLSELKTATVIHLATRMCHKEGYIVLSPNPVTDGSDLPQQASYIVTAEEIGELCLSAKLVVLSGGWGVTAGTPHHTGYRLAAAFLKAGCQCVLNVLWALPNCAIQKFYHGFYSSLRTGHRVAAAVREAIHRVRADNRFEPSTYWAPWQLVGKDTEVDLLQMRHAMLDQNLNRIEEEVGARLEKAKLNLKNPNPCVPTRGDNLIILQECMSSIISQHTARPDVICQLMDMCGNALELIKVDETRRQTARLSDSVMEDEAAIRLLKLLGFHFQGYGVDITEPYVIYPHHDKDNLIKSAFEALQATVDIVSDVPCAHAVPQMLPLTQPLITALVDLLCITKNAPDIQLNITDLAVKALWAKPKVNVTLQHIGFHQIGVLLKFSSTPSKKMLLAACLQLMIACSVHKSPKLKHKLEASLMGAEDSQANMDTGNCPRIDSLSPVLLPRKQIRNTVPWMTAIESEGEMEEKIKLSKSKAEVLLEFRRQMARTKSWHISTVAAQADEALEAVGRPNSSPQKVKVISGATLASPRIPVDQKPPATYAGVNQRRNYANYILQDRLKDVSLHQRCEEKKLYLPYIVNA